LLKDGMIEVNARFSDSQEQVAYQPTTKGNAISVARIVRRLNRAKADKLLGDFLRCVEEVNAHPDLLHWVTEVRVFGSYLTNSDDLGDIDIAIRKKRRPVSGLCMRCYGRTERQNFRHRSRFGVLFGPTGGAIAQRRLEVHL